MKLLIYRLDEQAADPEAGIPALPVRWEIIETDEADDLRDPATVIKRKVTAQQEWPAPSTTVYLVDTEMLSAYMVAMTVTKR